jgi:hypothetical protein
MQARKLTAGYWLETMLQGKTQKVIAREHLQNYSE